MWVNIRLPCGWIHFKSLSLSTTGFFNVNGISNTSTIAVSVWSSFLIIKQSIKFSEPHHLANYLYEISNLFNIFYQDENILNLDNEELKISKLLLTKYFLDTAKIVFSCLGIETVEEM